MEACKVHINDILFYITVTLIILGRLHTYTLDKHEIYNIKLSYIPYSLFLNQLKLNLWFNLVSYQLKQITMLCKF